MYLGISASVHDFVILGLSNDTLSTVSVM